MCHQRLGEPQNGIIRAHLYPEERVMTDRNTLAKVDAGVVDNTCNQTSLALGISVITAGSSFCDVGDMYHQRLGEPECGAPRRHIFSGEGTIPGRKTSSTAAETVVDHTKQGMVSCCRRYRGW